MSPTGPASDNQGMPDAEFSRLVQLIEATKSNSATMCKHYKVPNLRQLNQTQYGEAVDLLNKKLADMAKQETNKAAGFGEVLDDSIQF